MPALQIRDVPAELYERLKKASQAHHRSIAGEVLTILEEALAAREPLPYSRPVFDAISAVREQMRQSYGEGPSSTPLIREDRDR